MSYLENEKQYCIGEKKYINVNQFLLLIGCFIVSVDFDKIKEKKLHFFVQLVLCPAIRLLNLTQSKSNT